MQYFAQLESCWHMPGWANANLFLMNLVYNFLKNFLAKKKAHNKMSQR